MKTTRKITNADNLEARKNFIKSMATVALGTIILFSHFSILNADVNNANAKKANLESAIVAEKNTSTYIEEYNVAATRVNDRATQAPLFCLISSAMDIETFDIVQ